MCYGGGGGGVDDYYVVVVDDDVGVGIVFGGVCLGVFWDVFKGDFFGVEICLGCKSFGYVCFV